MPTPPLRSLATRVAKAGYGRLYGKRYADVPASHWVYVRPGEARAAELRWRAAIAAHRPVTLSSYAEEVPLGAIEEFLACPMCGYDFFRRLFNPGNGKQAGGWSYRVVRCEACGFLWRNPNIRPERLAELYADNYSTAKLTGSYAATAKRQRRYQLTMNAFSPLFKEGNGRRLFDFGCGSGLFLALAEELGFEVAGTDLSQDSLNLAQRRINSRALYFGSPADVPELATGGFDIVTMWSVLAHLPRPKDDLAMLRGLLNDTGALLILTVNAESLMLKAYGSKWNGFTMNHLMFYSRHTLPRLLQDAGFAALAFAPFYGDTVEAGTTRMSPRNQERSRRVVEETSGGNMLRALAFATREAAVASGLGHIPLA